MMNYMIILGAYIIVEIMHMVHIALVCTCRIEIYLLFGLVCNIPHTILTIDTVTGLIYIQIEPFKQGE